MPRCWGCGDADGYIEQRCNGCTRLYKEIDRLKRKWELMKVKVGDEYCPSCYEAHDIHRYEEWYSQRVEKLCDECFAAAVQAEQYDSDEIAKEAI